MAPSPSGLPAARLARFPDALAPAGLCASDFVAVWNKVMNLDRYDLKPKHKLAARP